MARCVSLRLGEDEKDRPKLVSSCRSAFRELLSRSSETLSSSSSTFDSFTESENDIFLFFWSGDYSIDFTLVTERPRDTPSLCSWASSVLFSLSALACAIFTIFFPCLFSRSLLALSFGFRYTSLWSVVCVCSGGLFADPDELFFDRSFITAGLIVGGGSSFSGCLGLNIFVYIRWIDALGTKFWTESLNWTFTSLFSLTKGLWSVSLACFVSVKSLLLR